MTKKLSPGARQKLYRDRAAERGYREALLQLPEDVIGRIDRYRETRRLNRSQAVAELVMKGMEGVMPSS